MWAKKDNITKIRSGCEDPYSEKDNLLQEVSSICQETGGLVIKKKKTVSKEKQSEEILYDGVDMDHDYCAELNDSVLSDLSTTSIPNAISVPANVPKTSRTDTRHVLLIFIEGPIRKRSNKSKPLTKDALGYLLEKNERERTLKNKELELETRKLLLEERKLLLEEKKVEWDITERKEKLEIEKKIGPDDIRQVNYPTLTTVTTATN